MDGPCKLSNTTDPLSEVKSLFSIVKTKRAMVFAYGFMFAFMLCSAFLFCNSITDTSLWFTSLFASPNSTDPSSPTSSTRSIFSSILPSQNPSSSSSATLDNTIDFSRSSNVSTKNTQLLNHPPKPRLGNQVFGNSTKNPTQNSKVINDQVLARNGSVSDRNNRGKSESSEQKKKNEVTNDCDIFNGRWVTDESYPFYKEGSCPYIDEPFDCFLNHRPDNGYQRFRWQPNSCSIPRLNATDMLERLRGKRLVFVGDSLNRNMWESLVCVLRNSIRDKKRVFEASGKHEFRTEGFYSIRFTDYNCSIEFFRAPFLVQESEIRGTNGSEKETLRLDIIEQSSFKFKDADVVVFNTGHWWTHEKTSKGKDYYQEGDHIFDELNVLEAFKKALRTWARWIDSNINPKKTHVFFRGYSASHFRGGQWNSGGQCHRETEPIMNETFLQPYPPMMGILESVIGEMKTPISYLNITRMTDYRKDAHPSIYRKPNLTEEERLSPERFQDCSHWCLPGLPDTWNELLYAMLIRRKQ